MPVVEVTTREYGSLGSVTLWNGIPKMLYNDPAKLEQLLKNSLELASHFHPDYRKQPEWLAKHKAIVKRLKELKLKELICGSLQE